MRVIRPLARLALLLWAIASVVLATTVLAQHPFVSPIVERTTAEARRALLAAVATTVTPEWIGPRIEAALSEGDLPRVKLLNEMAQENGVTLLPSQRARVDEVLSTLDGWRATAGNCIRCMGNINACPDLALIASCTIPFELTLGDAAAVTRQGLNLVKGDEVDEVEAALGALGVVTTAATVLSLGGSAPLKAGLTTLRVARKVDAISPKLLRSLTVAAKTEGGLQAVLIDTNRIRRSTSSGEALMVLRHADDAEELSRLARLSEVSGPKTRNVLEALGKPRSLRLLERVSDLAVAALGLMALVAAQIGTLLLAMLKLMLRRIVKPRNSAKSFNTAPTFSQSPPRSPPPR